MRKILSAAILLALVFASFATGNWYQKRHQNGDSAHAQIGRKILYYADPMNPGVKSDKPGVAPCGMALEPVYADGISDCSGMPPGTVNVSPEKQQLIGVKVETVEKKHWEHTIRVLGRVVPDENRLYRINSATDGWVKKVLPVTTGSLVRRDELLATFYAPEFFSAIKAYLYGLRSMDRFESSGKETKEQIELTDANIDSYKNALRNLGMSEHQLNDIKNARLGPDNIEVRAPEPGFIVARNISLGQRFEKGTELYRIADLSHVWILADIFENESEYFKSGVAARVKLPHQNKAFNARVSGVLPQFDPASRTLKMRLETGNPGYLLRPDMFVDVELPVTLPACLNVPVGAVLFSGLKKTVYVDLGNGMFEPRAVETGWQFGDRVEVVSGLMPGERVVVSGNFLIDSESRMRCAAAGLSGASHKDPVCGMDVDEGKAKAAGMTSRYGGKEYYFCAESCKKRFDKDPGTFLKKSGATHD